jgi:hypothetical protein
MQAADPANVEDNATFSSLIGMLVNQAMAPHPEFGRFAKLSK